MGKIVIVDYLIGNLFNVQRAFNYIGEVTNITNKVEDIENASKIVLPGVGAFSEGIKQLKKNGLDLAIIDSAKRGKPILGICLGMQLLLSESEEHGNHKGLNLIPGKVVKFDSPKGNDKFKIPQIGWNNLLLVHEKRNNNWNNTILEGLAENEFMYFVHSFYVNPDNKNYSLAETDYGYNRFCSVIAKENIIGCQFHPERSGLEGIKILRNFVNMK
jgi:imidazole glycerol-phosphate synthase subunit HisH